MFIFSYWVEFVIVDDIVDGIFVCFDGVMIKLYGFEVCVVG